LQTIKISYFFPKKVHTKIGKGLVQCIDKFVKLKDGAKVVWRIRHINKSVEVTRKIRAENKKIDQGGE
jgi:hypothetical protein